MDVAKKLALMRTEAALRTAVGRGYYAAFNCAAQLLLALGFSMNQSASDHEKVYYDLKNCGISDIEEAAKILYQLRRRRNEADYKMSSTDFVDHLACEFDLTNSKFIVSEIERFSHEPLRTQLKNGILEYHRKIGL
ncbi:MAG: hypothetical protein ACRENG_09035 [bacterium]